MASLDGYDKKSVLRIDKPRKIDYNGEIIKMNIYLCNNCKEPYTLEQVKHNYCPFCGTQYTSEIDVSVGEDDSL